MVHVNVHAGELMTVPLVFGRANQILWSLLVLSYFSSVLQQMSDHICLNWSFEIERTVPRLILHRAFAGDTRKEEPLGTRQEKDRFVCIRYLYVHLDCSFPLFRCPWTIILFLSMSSFRSVTPTVRSRPIFKQFAQSSRISTNFLIKFRAHHNLTCHPMRGTPTAC